MQSVLGAVCCLHLTVAHMGIAISCKRNPKKKNIKRLHSPLAILYMTTMTWKMTTGNWKTANLDRQDTQQVSPCSMHADRLYLLWRDMQEGH